MNILDGEKFFVIAHCIPINDINSFLTERKVLTTQDYKHRYNYKKWHWCLSCFSRFDNAELLSNHEKLCLNRSNQINVMPKEGDTLRFKHHNRKFKSDIVGVSFLKL